MARRIYLASSWRNPHQPHVVSWLRGVGHEVYDFRNPTPGDNGFSWESIDPEWENWTPAQYLAALKTDVAHAGYWNDKSGLDWADTGVLLLPCGRSAHLEAGYLIGQQKPIFILLEGQNEPELMYLLAARICISRDDLESQLWHLDHSHALPATTDRMAG